MDISSIFGSQNSIDRLVSQYMTLERGPLDLLINKKESLDGKRSILSDLDSKLSALKRKADRLTDPVFNYFATKKATTSDLEKFTATAGPSSAAGNHSVSVARLAESDTRVSSQFNNNDTSFTGYVTDQTFDIEVTHIDDDGNESRELISVNVAASLFTGTDEEVLSSISDAINSAMSNAVSDETLNSDEVIHASVVNESSATSRLVLRSENTGYTYRMDFGSSSLLDDLQVNANVASSGTAGGYIHEIGTSETDSMLNNMFTVDGLTLYRDSNNVTDAIEGVTLQLLDTFATNETISITADVESVQGEIEDFLEAYNSALTFLKTNTQIDPDTYKRGLLADDLTYKNIYYDLRNHATEEVDTTSSTLYTKLYQLGIEPDDDGYLSITDSEKFTRAVETNSTYVSDIFSSEDGFATRLVDYVNRYVKTGGTIDNTKKNIDDEIIHINDRIDYTNDILARREAQLRNEMTKLQETMVLLQNQQSYLGLFSSNNYGSSFYY